ESFEYLPAAADGNPALPHVRLPAATQIAEYDGDDGATPRIVRSELRYESYDPSAPQPTPILYGNVTRRIDKGDPANGLPDRITVLTYATPNLDRYLVSQVATIETVAPGTPETVLQRSRLFYDDEEQNPQAMPSKGLITKRERWLSEGGVEY